MQEVYRDILVIKQQQGETLYFAWNKKVHLGYHWAITDSKYCRRFWLANQ